MGGIGNYPFKTHLDLACLAMEAIGSWSHVEAALLTLYTSLMGGASERAARIYLSLSSDGPKSAAITAAADYACENGEIDRIHRALVIAILSVAKNKRTPRDRLAHWVWG